MAKKIELDLLSKDLSGDSIQTLTRLWGELEKLPDGAHKEYVWDECFDILSSLMRTLLKTVPNIDNDVIEKNVETKISRMM